MSKRGQETQGGEERYGFTNDNSGNAADKPMQATAAQMARRKIAAGKKTASSARSSRANTPNAFGAPQSMPTFQTPQEAGSGGHFDFSVAFPSNPFQNASGASATPPPNPFGAPAPQQNGGGGMFGTNTSFGATFNSNGSSQPQQNGSSFGQNNTNGSGTPSFGGFGQSNSNVNSTPSFGGFGQNNQSQSQQQNGMTSKTNAPFSFGQTNGNAPFKFGQDQAAAKPAPSAAFSFGQNAQTNGGRAGTPSFGGFGQSTQESAPKASTPSFGGFGQSTQQSAPKAATPSFGGFGQAPAQKESTPSFFSNAQADQTPKPSTGNSFTFGQQNQTNGSSTPFGAQSRPAETPKASSSNPFGNLQNGSTGMFGAKPTPQATEQNIKPGDSIFNTQNNPKTGSMLFTSDMAEGAKPDAPKMPSFGQSTQQNGRPSSSTEQTPKASNMFGGFNPSQSSAAQDTPKPSGNLFSASTFGQTPSQQSNTSKSLFSQPTQEKSMFTPSAPPHKQVSFAPSAPQTTDPTIQGNSGAETPAAGRSLFDRISKPAETPSTATEAQKPLFAPATQTPSQGFAPQSQTPATAQKSSFAPSTSFFDKSQPQPTPSTSLFDKSNEAAPSVSQLAPQSSPTKAAASAQPAQPTSVTPTSTSSKIAGSESEKQTLETLNQGLLAHLTSQDSKYDWTAIMEYYVQQAAIIRGKPASKDGAPSATPVATSRPSHTTAAPGSAAPQQSSNSFGGSSAPASEPMKPTAPQQLKAPTPFKRFTPSDDQQTPKPFAPEPPATAPLNRKRSAESDAERPATEKRARQSESTEYPKLPDNASNTAKLFAAALDKPKTASPTFSHATPSAPSFQPSTSGFTPSNVAGLKPRPTPSTGGFTPVASGASSGNFLAAFGKQAADQEAKDREKRKDADYDSEDETEEAWRARDKAEQETKRAKYLEAAKSTPGFMFGAASKPAGAQKETQEGNGGSNAAETTGTGKSLFDRTSKAPKETRDSPSIFQSQTPAAKAPGSNMFGSTATPKAFSGSSNLFGHLAKPDKAAESSDKGDDVEKDTQGTGDKTFNQNTPIKFGLSASSGGGSTTPAAPPPAFGGLFGSTASKPSFGGSSLLDVPKPATGFNFGGTPSVNGSRTTTPGVTTDSEGAGAAATGETNGEPSDDVPADTQVEDMAGLSPEELEHDTLLYSVVKSKCQKLDEKKDEAGETSKGWVERGRGPLYVLKNKESGKVKVLMKMPPLGNVRMNFAVLKQSYEVVGKGGKQISCTFWDHLGERPGLGRWLITVSQKEEAEAIARILSEAAAELEG